MAFGHAVACLLSIAMLLSFPASRFHSFSAHFRTPEVRRTTERNTLVTEETRNPRESIPRSELLPTFFAPAEPVSVKIIFDRNLDSHADFPLVHLLSRLKLNPPGSGGEDPLLQA